MTPSSSSATTNISSVFETGLYKTLLQNVKTSSSSSGAEIPPPKPLLIAAPTEAGEFPVLVYLHGYLLSNSLYSQLIQHVASHGFIVIAPQLYPAPLPPVGPDSTDEIKSVSHITCWLARGGLQLLLPPHVRPNLTKLALAGHSRGGKAAFAHALGLVSPSPANALPFSALLGIDPVDGMGKGKQTQPPVLTYAPRSFDLSMPVMVIGSGLGELKTLPFFPASAPKGVNHEDFFRECRAPACHFVAEKYGHIDVLDDNNFLIDILSWSFIKSGSSRGPMRRFVGGAVVAFLRAHLEGDETVLMGLRDGLVVAPVELRKEFQS